MKQTLDARILAANEELLNKGNAAAVAEFFTPNYVVHLVDQDLRGHPMIKSFIKELRRAFPDLRVEVEILVSKGSRVAWQRTFRATHRGAFKGFPASGRTMLWRDMLVTRFEQERIAEEWAVSDLAEHLLAARH